MDNTNLFSAEHNNRLEQLKETTYGAPMLPPKMHHMHMNEPIATLHKYNKICYKSYKDAIHMLTNLELLPGQFAVAYYYDRDSTYGVSAILGVGSLKKGAGNILFDNIEQLAKKLIPIQNDINEIIESIESQSIELEKVNEEIITLNDTMKDFYEKNVIIDEEGNIEVIDTKAIKQKVNNLNTSLIDLNTSLIDFKNNIEEELNTLYDEVNINASMIESNTALINDVSSAVDAQSKEIELLRNEINQTTEGAIDIVESEIYTYVDIKDASLEEYVNNSLIELNAYVNEQDSSIIELIDNLVTNVNNTNASIVETIESQKEEITNYIDEQNKELQFTLTSMLNDCIDELSLDLNDTINDTKSELKIYVDETSRGIMHEIRETSTNANNKINDLATKVDADLYNMSTLLKKDFNDKIEETLSYIDLKDTQLEEKITDYNKPLEKHIADVSKIVHEMTDADADIYRYIETVDSSLQLYINEEIYNVQDSFLDLSTKLMSDMYKLEVKINDFISTADSSLKHYTDRQIDTLKSYTDSSLIHIKNVLSIKDSDLEAKYKTLTTSVNSSIKEITSTFNDMLTDKFNTLKTTIKSEDSSMLTYIEKSFLKIADMPENVYAGDGIIKQDGKFRLAIDSNGILTVGTKKYQLTPYNY